jgi:hypothetical protein
MSGKERNGGLLPILASTCGALLLCVAMVASGMQADEVGAGEFMLMDWGTLQVGTYTNSYACSLRNIIKNGFFSHPGNMFWTCQRKYRVAIFQ